MKVNKLMLLLSIFSYLYAQNPSPSDEDKMYEELLKKLEMSAKEEDKKQEVVEKVKEMKVTNKTYALLPEPFKSLKIGRKVIVYAKYKEPVLTSSATPESDILDEDIISSFVDGASSSVGNFFDAPEINIRRRPNPNAEVLPPRPSEVKKAKKDTDPSPSNLKYADKIIKLYIGQSFNGWHVEELSTTYVIFKSDKSDKTIKKYY